MKDMDVLIQIDGLSLSLGGNPVLRDIHLELRAGEIYGLLGPNGAGKSTTIGATLGLLRPDGGTIKLFGQAVSGDMAALRGRLGVLTEQNGFYDWMTAEDYLAFYASLYGNDLTAPEIASRLASVGLAPRDGQAIGSFSRGMRQRLGLARALVGDPEILILDEPTNGLDPRGRREIHDTLLSLAATGAGILLCTHLLDDVDRLCARVGIMVEGRTVAEGLISDLVRESGHLSRFRLRLAGEPPADSETNRLAKVVAREGEWSLIEIDASEKPELVWRELMFRGWPIVEIQRERGGLEELYLELTERKAA
jgi:ABC-type multidrug transport system ATPase subunit